MDTLKQLQEKGEEEFKESFGYLLEQIKVTPYYGEDIKKAKLLQDLYSKININILNFLHQQTTLAFEAGKAETIAMVLKEIEKSYHGYGSGDGYLIDRGFNIALDTLKTKLQAKE